MWAIRADVLPRLLDLARQTAALGVGATSSAAKPPALAASVTGVVEASGVAVIPLCGVLTPHGSFLSYLFGGGGGGVNAFREELACAVQDPSISAIVLDVDSPGGSIGLVPEAAAEVRAARQVKPVYAVANTQAASGAYYIAAQATKLYCTPSGMVGSVGVYYVHEDFSGFNEQRGIDVSYIYAGQYKTEGNPDEPLSDDARAAWQADADKLYSLFLADVAKGRGATVEQVRNNYGQGRTLLAEDALAAGMIDGLDTIQAVVSRALQEATTSTGPSARRVGRAAVIRAPARLDSRVEEDDDDEDKEEDEEEQAEEQTAPPELPPEPVDSDENDENDDDEDEDDDDEDAEHGQAAAPPRDPAVRRLIALRLLTRS